MENPSLEEIDGIRKQGLRPQVVGCFLYGKRLLFVFNKEYDLWQLPQGGIDNLETIGAAFSREMREELGQAFLETINADIMIFGEDQIIFPPALQGSRELKTDSGQSIKMKGKKYFFVAAESDSPDIKIQFTEFDDYKWVFFSEGTAIADAIQQGNKRRLTRKALDMLKRLDLVV